MSKPLIAAVASALVIVVTIVLFNQYVDRAIANTLENSTFALNAHIAQQELMLNSVADLTRQLGADEITEQIIVDCNSAERVRFDQLLGQLGNNLTNSDLRELDTLFYKCGSFYADRKSAMAARLMREVDVYEDYLTLRSNISASNDDTSRVIEWHQIATMELELAENFNKLVDLQGQIILTLLAGKSPTSPEIQAILDEVTATRNNMTVMTQQIEKIRAELRTI